MLKTLLSIFKTYPKESWKRKGIDNYSYSEDYGGWTSDHIIDKPNVESYLKGIEDYKAALRHKISTSSDISKESLLKLIDEIAPLS